MLLAVTGVWIRGLRREDAFLWAIVGSFALVHTVFFPTTRLVTPMVFVWMVFAAVTTVKLRALNGRVR
ncbi:MAG TPA: hypothetical protein VNJ03_17885 [Vicinamibacterales bacterium]|nr:hypothetical protein [Vicinamibacterales bacterium]